jgi:hypothetical protein
MTEKTIGAGGASVRSKHENHRIVKRGFYRGGDASQSAASKRSESNGRKSSFEYTEMNTQR